MTTLDGATFDLQAAHIARLVHHIELGSTMDEAHALGEQGAEAGTVVLADQQHTGRGRSGKRWQSPPGDGLYFTLLERDVAPAALGVLSLRVGLAVAALADRWCEGVVGLKWPNDVLVRHSARRTFGKLAGILVEARWRDAHPEWVAIGVGINLRGSVPVPGVSEVAALPDGLSRAAVLTALVPPLREAARRTGMLSALELTSWRRWDAMVGRRVSAPAPGVVEGINANGALLLSRLPSTEPPGAERCARLHAYRSGSLIIEEERQTC